MFVKKDRETELQEWEQRLAEKEAALKKWELQLKLKEK